VTLPAYVKASAAVHAAAGAAALFADAAWPWALGAVAREHAGADRGGLWPRSRWLGRNWTRLPEAAAERREIAITIDDGPDPEVTPAVLDALDAHRAARPSSSSARRPPRHPALVREIARRGHGVQNHSDRHSHAFSLMGRARWRARSARRRPGSPTSSASRRSGSAPPAGLRNPFLAPVLDRLGLELVSWTRRGFDTVRREPEGVLARLCENLSGGRHPAPPRRPRGAHPDRRSGRARRPAGAARAHRRGETRPVTLADALPAPRPAAAGALVAASR
jgi:hypothetical protein